MGSGFSFIRKVNKKMLEKNEEEIEAEQEQMDESCSSEKLYYFSRAIMPHLITVEGNPYFMQNAQNGNKRRPRTCFQELWFDNYMIFSFGNKISKIDHPSSSNYSSEED